jgi:hypothetical protein
LELFAMNLLSKVGIVSLVVLLNGCAASWNSLYRIDEGANNVRTITVDAKQRFAFQAKVGANTVICPEGSPDALQAFGASGSLDANVLGKALGLSAGTGEAAASIGLRTQSIQLLRDQLVFLCLMRIAQPDMPPSDLVELFRRYQIATVGILAIEQLTGTIKAPPAVVSIGSQSSSGKTDAASADKLPPDTTSDTTSDSKKPSAPASTKASVTPGASSFGTSMDQGANSAGIVQIAQSVEKIVTTVITQAFGQDSCLQRKLVASSKPDTPRPIDYCGVTQYLTCMQTINSELNCAKLLGNGNAADGLKKISDAGIQPSRELNEAIIKSTRGQGARTTLENFDVGVFYCTADRTTTAKRLEMESAIQAKTSGRVYSRGTKSDAELASRGFSVGGKSQILYDNGEEAYSALLQSIVENSGIRNPETSANPADQRTTAFYLSIAVCQQ